MPGVVRFSSAPFIDRVAATAMLALLIFATGSARRWRLARGGRL